MILRPTITAIVTITAMLAVCGNSEASTGKTTVDASAGGTATPDGEAGHLADGAGEGLEVIYLSAPLADPNYGAVACGARIEADRLGVDLSHQESADFSAAGQIPDLNAAAAAGPDALMVTPTDPQGLVEPLNAIVADGTPVITTINELADPSGITGEVAVDNQAAGRLAAAFIAQQADGQEVSVAALSFLAGGSLAADGELAGFEEEISKHDNINYIGPTYVESEASSSTAAMNAVLSREPDLFGVFTAFGASAQGVLASTRQRDVTPIIVSGYAANTGEIVEALKSGEVSAIVDFPFREAGAAALRAAVAAALGEPGEQRQVFESMIFLEEDAESLGEPCPA